MTLDRYMTKLYPSIRITKGYENHCAVRHYLNAEKYLKEARESFAGQDRSMSDYANLAQAESSCASLVLQLIKDGFLYVI